VLAATNFGVGSEYEGISSLDEALIRRFDNKVYVDLPNQDERKEYILMMKNKKNLTGLSDKVAESIAERTTGQSLAILQNVIELAQRNAIKENREVSDDDLLTALEEYIYGEKKEHTPEYYQKVAIHESGHAYVSYISGDKPSYITIESRGNFGGYMQHANQEDIPEYSKEDLLAKIRCALGGRAAEKVFYGDEKSLNTGASSDLAHATDLAWRIICTYGMEDQLMVLRKEEILASPMAADYVAKVNEMLNREMKNTVEIIENAKEKIRSIADTLVKENRLTGAQFEELMEQK
jgi:ATP-dependent Zn protease